MKPLRTERLVLRQWEERDRALFHRINSDDKVMRFFPLRRNREQSDAMMDHLSQGIDRDGYGFAAAALAETGEAVGFIGIVAVNFEQASIPAGSYEIGWRLAPEFWGKGYASEGAEAWLEFGFANLDLPEIVSFAVWNNKASTAVMSRIGMNLVSGGEFDHPSVPDSHPELKRHVLYRLGIERWLERQTDKKSG